MSFKKRPQPSQADIEAFGDAADQPRAAAVPAASVRPAAVPARASSAGEWPQDVARTMLVRWPTPEMSTQLVEATALLKSAGDIDGRSQHSTALRALQIGLDAIMSGPQR